MSSRPATIIERLVAGDREAATEVGRWVRRAASAFRSQLGADWEDVVQDSLVEVLEAVRDERFRGDGSERGYVWRTTASNCLDRLRRRRRRQFLDLDAAAPELPALPATARDDLLQTQARDRLVSLAAQQSASCRELWRDILAGRSYREMSERLGISEGALRVRVLRCRRRAIDMATGGSVGRSSDSRQTAAVDPAATDRPATRRADVRADVAFGPGAETSTPPPATPEPETDA